MSFRDEWVTDEDGNRFVFTVEMQRQLSAAGLPVEPASLDQLEQMPERPRSAEPSYGRPRDAQPPAARPRDAQPPAARPRDDAPPARTPSAPREVEGPEAIQIDPKTGKYIGRVKWYNARKGYGFIIRGAGEEIFFHKSGSVGDPTNLEDGEWVLYDVEDTKKGPEATDVEHYDGDTPE